jgi:hypothetical protein
VIAVVVLFATRSSHGTDTPPVDSATVRPAAVPQPVASQPQPTPVVASPDTAQRKPPAVATVEKKTPSVAKTPPTKAVEKAVPAPRPTPPEPDVFRITVASSPPPMHVGDKTTLRATIDRVSGSGAMPRVDWQSGRPGVASVDAAGNVTAVAEGQATLTASGGGARADVSITVLAAAVVAPPPPQPPVKATGPSPEEIRSKGVDALRETANAMAAALRAKDVATATRLFGDARSGDAQDLLRQLPNLYDLKVTAQISQPQVTDRAASVDYQLKFEWATQAGPLRNRTVVFHAEAERANDTWTIARHRLVSGWR